MHLMRPRRLDGRTLGIACCVEQFIVLDVDLACVDLGHQSLCLHNIVVSDIELDEQRKR